MKTILLWDRRDLAKAPVRLTIADELASAAVRAGVAAPVNPAETAALLAGGPLLESGSTVDAVIELGAGGQTARVALPLSVAQAGLASGKVAGIGRALPRPAVVSSPVILDPCRALTNSVANSGAVLAVEQAPEPHPDGTSTWVSMTCPAGDVFVSKRFPITGGLRLVDLPIVMLWVQWPGLSGSVEIAFTSDAFAAKTKRFGWAYSSQLHPGWNLLTIRPDDDGTTAPGGLPWTVAGGFADTDVLTHYEVRISTNGASATKISLGGMGYYPARPAKGAVILGFDAFGEASVPDLALPILQEFGLLGYWAGDANLVQNPGNARDRLKRWHDAGNDVVNQGLYHPAGGYVAAGAALLSSQYDISRAILDDAGFTRGRRVFAYPFSANDAATDAVLLQKGVRIARSGWPWMILPSEYRAGAKLIGHGGVNMGGKTLAAMKTMADRAEKYGGTLVPFPHGLVAGGDGTAPPANVDYWYRNDYRSFVQYIAAKRDAGTLDVLSFTQWLEQRGQALTTA
jgi:hypothetical protein